MNLHYAKKTDKNNFYIKTLFIKNKISELQVENWPEDLKTQLLDMQYLSQEKLIKEHFPNASDNIIYCNKTRVGRLVYDSSDSNLHIIDIIIEKEFQNRGIGTELINSLKKQYESISLNVAENNPAINLYIRLGFKIIKKNDLQYFMKCNS